MIAGTSKTAALALIALVLSLTEARAQFVGDLFYEDSSVAVAAGETATLDLNFFSGATAFGAAEVELSWNPSELELLDVSLPANVAATLTQVTETDAAAGTLKLAVINLSNINDPIGTVIMARLTVKPLVGTGLVTLTASQAAALTTARTAYARNGGAVAELVVQAASAQPAARSGGGELPRIADPDAALAARAARIGQPGGWVEMVVEGLGIALVRVPADGTAPSD